MAADFGNRERVSGVTSHAYSTTQNRRRPRGTMMPGALEDAVAAQERGDFATGLRLLHQLAEEGSVDAQLELGVTYRDGAGVPRDPVLSYLWFTVAAEKGDERAIECREAIASSLGGEIGDLVLKAVRGDHKAERDISIRLHNGDGISQDLTAATIWMKKAAGGGDPWAQTTLAITLRKTNEPGKQQESVRWLELASNQGDARAKLNLGLQQLLGIGTPVDREAGVANLMTASLAGLDDAKTGFEKNRNIIPETSWPSIFDRVAWTDLTFLLGPIAEGHLDGIRLSQENDDGSDEALWLKHERDAANIMFLGSEGTGSVLEMAFGKPVRVKNLFVGRALYEGKPVASAVISLRDVVLEDGFPVWWKPSDDALDATAASIGLLGVRDWVRWLYTQAIQ